MNRTHYLLLLVPLLGLGCQGLEPLPKIGDSGATGGGEGSSDVVELGDLRIAPGSVNFGVVGLGEESVQTVVLTNTGTDAIILRQATLEGDSPFQYSTSTLPLQLDGSGEVAIDVTFAPEAAENYTAGLSLDLNSLDEPYVVEISGAGEGAIVDTGDTDTDPPTGELVASPSSVNFGDVPTNQAGSYDVVITNTHTDNILIQQIVGNPSEFGYQLGGEVTLPQVIAPDESRTLTLTFDPATETPHSGTVELTLDVSGTSSALSIPVQGVGVEPPCSICAPIVSVSPQPLEVRAPLGCEQSASAAITNVGDQDLVISDIYLTNGSWACGTFTLTGGSTTATLSPGSSTNIEVTFTANAPLCSESSDFARDVNVLHIQNNSGQPDYQAELSGYATCPQ